MNGEFEKSEMYFEELSTQILLFIREYRESILGKIIESERCKEEPERFFYTIIVKILSSFEAANIFIRNFDSSRDFQIPLCIILRSILNDIIVTEGVIIFSKNDDERIQNIERLYFDHVQNVVNSISFTEWKVRGWDQIEKEKEVLEIKRKYPRYYDVDGKEKIKPFQTSINSLVKRIFSSSNDENSLKFIKTAFNLYSTYSKFEHFGEFTFYLIHRVNNENKQRYLIYELFSSIRITVSALSNYARVWDDLDIDYQVLKNLENKLQKLAPK